MYPATGVLSAIGIGDSVRHVFVVVLYSFTSAIGAPNALSLVDPPIAQMRSPSTTVEALKCDRGLGSAAFCVHVSVVASYIHTSVWFREPSFQSSSPPSA